MLLIFSKPDLPINLMIGLVFFERFSNVLLSGKLPMQNKTL